MIHTNQRIVNYLFNSYPILVDTVFGLINNDSTTSRFAAKKRITQYKHSDL